MPTYYSEEGIGDTDLIDDNGEDSLLIDYSNEAILTADADPLKYLVRLEALRSFAQRVKATCYTKDEIDEMMDYVIVIVDSIVEGSDVTKDDINNIFKSDDDEEDF